MAVTLRCARGPLALLLLAALPLRAADWYVAPPPAGNDANTGRSPATPLATVSAAAARAGSGDTIHAAAGTYDENPRIDGGVTLLGEDPATTILDGGRRDTTLRLGDGATLERFTVRNGFSADRPGGVAGGRCVLLRDVVVEDSETGSGGSPAAAGGVTLNADGRLERTSILRNRAGDAVTSDVAGGVAALFNLTLVDVLVEGNTSGRSGPSGFPQSAGGVLVFGGGATLLATRTQVLRNVSGDSATGGVLVHGGGAWAELASSVVGFNRAGDAVDDAAVGGARIAGGGSTLCGGTFDRNTAGRGSMTDWAVGGVLVEGGGADAHRVVATGNVAGADAVGGLLVRGGGCATLDSFAVGNEAGDDGIGGIAVFGALASLTGSAASGNTAGARGVGGTFMDGVSLTSIGCTATGNLAGDGGVGGFEGALAEAFTIASNQAGVGGVGGARGPNAGLRTIELRHVILAHNTGGLADDCREADSLGFNLIESPATCSFVAQPTDVIGVDPLLAPLADNGGPTPTRALLPGSPALDAGAIACAATDQRGMPRPQGPACDIGAFERCDAGPCAPLPPVACSPPSFPPDDCGRVSPCSSDAQPPALAGVPADVAVACDEVPAMPVVTASDDCDPAPTVTSDESRIDGPCDDAYAIVRTWTARDAAGNATSATQRITVSDVAAPALAGAPGDVTVECDAVPAPPVVTASDACDPSPAVAFAERRDAGACPGSYALTRTWTATDRCGNAASASQVVTVVDTTPPVVAASAGAIATLRPPNHRMACFSAADFAPVVSDACSEPVTWRFVGCASDQPDDAREDDPSSPWNGDGTTTGDGVVADDGLGFCVRAERAGRGPGAQGGRRYAVTIVAIDACGNASAPTEIGGVVVPHDRGGARARRAR